MTRLRYYFFTLVLTFVAGAIPAHSGVVVIPLAGDDAKNLKNVITVAKANGDFINPVVAINSIPATGPDIPSATNRYLIVIGPGEFDIGSESLEMREWVSIQGSGRESTKIIGALSTDSPGSSSAVVTGANNAALTDMSIENIGGKEYSFALYNIYASASPRIERINAHAQGGSALNIGIQNREEASPTMTDVVTTASGGLDSVGLAFDKSASIVTNVIARGEGGSLSNFGVQIVYPSSSDSLVMTNIQAVASGGSSRTIGVSIRLSASPGMSNIHARSSGGRGANYGMYIEGSSPFIKDSVIEGSTNGLWFDANSKSTTVVNSKLSSVSDGAPNSQQCRETYNHTLVDVDC